VAEVRPFRGLRYRADASSDLAPVLCPPYDVIAPAEADALRAVSPHNAIHLELPVDQGATDRYTAAAASLAAWQAAGVLVREERPAWYAVEEEFAWGGQPHRRRGVLVLVRLAPWEDDVVLPHERTLAGPKADRLALLEACATNLSPVFLLHPPRPAAEDALWRAGAARPPLAEATLGPADRLRLWAIEADATDWGAALADARLYVADGHHRYETALRYRDERQRTSGQVPVGADYVLAYLVSTADPGLLLLPTHRCAPADGVDLAALEALLAERFSVETVPPRAGDGAAPTAALARVAAAASVGTALGIYTPGNLRIARPREAALQLLPAERAPAWRALDVAQADSLLFQPLLGSDAAERLTYTRDAAEALGRVDDGAAAFAVLLNPLGAGQMAAVAEAHERMPQKSTYFYPKLPTGLLFHRLDDLALG
jgi:uncharacterized protein (DUF1015 family)